MNVKKQRWPYSDNKHLDWINTNIKMDDIHVFLYLDKTLAAYLNLVQVNMQIGENSQAALGIGNVCTSVKFDGIGLGRILLSYSSHIAKGLDKTSILFCKDQLVDFYKANGFFLFRNKTFINNEEYPHNFMTNKIIVAKAVSINRIF